MTHILKAEQGHESISRILLQEEIDITHILKAEQKCKNISKILFIEEIKLHTSWRQNKTMRISAVCYSEKR